MSTAAAAGHVAVVLAAGGSTRLGRPKQLLMRDGEPLLVRAARLAKATRAHRVFVVLGAQRERMAIALEGAGCEIIHNAAWQQGLSSSLLAVAPHVQSHAKPVLIMACDQPALEQCHLQALLEGAARSHSGCAATRHASALGIPAVVPSAWFARDAELRGDHGFGAALSAGSPADLFVLDAPELQLDLDTSEDIGVAVALGLLDLREASA